MVFAKRAALDSMASRMRRDRTQPGAILVLGLPVLALDVLALHVLGLRLLDLLAFLALMAVWTLAGSLFLHRQRHAFPDRFTFYAVSAVLGMAIAMSAWFVGFQSSLLEGLGNPDPLPHTARERRDGIVYPVEQVHLFQNLADPLLPVSLLPKSFKQGAISQILACGQMIIQAEVLRQVADQTVRRSQIR